MTAETKVLFVCVHNAARSRIAEALLRKLGGPRFEVVSAGFEPQEANPLAPARSSKSMSTMQIITPRAVDTVQANALGSRGTDVLAEVGACGPRA